MGSHTMRTFSGSWIRFACCSVVLSSLLAACGGGGGSGSTPAQTSTPSPPVTGSPSSPTPPPLESSGNTTPTIAGTAQAAVTAGQSYSFKPSAADADKGTVTFTIAYKPSWAAFFATTGVLSGTLV